MLAYKRSLVPNFFSFSPPFGFKRPPLKPHQDSCTFLNRKYFYNNNAK